jgi:hypothetical protein
LGLALRWGYGSVSGVWRGLLRRRLPEPWASGAFGATLMTATLTMFPLLGRTPPALALATKRHCDRFRYPRRIRRGRGRGRRSGPACAEITWAVPVPAPIPTA